MAGTAGPARRRVHAAHAGAAQREHVRVGRLTLGEKLRQARLLVGAERAADRDELERVGEAARSAELTFAALLEERLDGVAIVFAAEPLHELGERAYDFARQPLADVVVMPLEQAERDRLHGRVVLEERDRVADVELAR